MLYEIFMSQLITLILKKHDEICFSIHFSKSINQLHIFKIMLLRLYKSYFKLNLAFTYHVHACDSHALCYSLLSTSQYFNIPTSSFKFYRDNFVNGCLSTMNVHSLSYSCSTFIISERAFVLT